MNLNNVLMLTGTNYRAWLDSVENYMGMHENIDYCFTKDKSAEFNEKSTKKETDLYKKWHKSNRMAKNLIRTSMSKTVRGSIEEPELASDFLELIAAKFKESEKAKAARLTKEFHDLKYMGSGGVREHIMKMINIYGRLRELLMGVRDEQVVHYALHSLPNSFSHLRTSYNSPKGNWTLDELISICVDEQARIKEEKEPATAINLIENPKKKKPQNKLKPTKVITKSSTAAVAKENRPFSFKCSKTDDL